MYQNIYYDRKEKIVHLWDDEKGLVQFEYQPYCYRKAPGGKYRSMFGDELAKSYKYSYDEEGLFESDVPAETRVLIDLYGDDDSISKNHCIFTFDIEVGSIGGHAKVEKPWQPVTSIAFTDSISNIRQVLIWDEKKLVSDTEYNDDRGRVIITSYRTEKELLLGFLEKYEKIQPTVLTGWNICGYDIPYLFNRLTKIFGQNTASRLSPIGVVILGKKMDDGMYDLKIAGISCLDYLDLYKMYTVGKPLPNYRLGTVGMVEVKMNKLEYKGDLKTLFALDIHRFIQYNLTDVDIVVAIDKKNKFIELSQSICHLCHVPYEFSLYSSKFLEGAVLTYLRKNGLVANNKPKKLTDEEKKIKDDEDDVGFEGAFVKEPIPGKYKWIFDLDLESLYPGIMRSLNISPETLIGKVYSHIEPAKPKLGGKKNEMIPARPVWSSENYARGKIDRVFLTEEACWQNLDSGDDVVPFEEFKQRILEKNISIASNGAMYKNDVVGILPQILTIWFDKRVEYRKLEKKYGNEGDSEKYAYYNTLQKAQKVFLNSIYGALGLPGWRFYELINAEAVTLTGQTVIKTSEKMGNQYYNTILGDTKDHCIYVDTDSIFFSADALYKHSNPNSNPNDDEMIAFTRKTAGEVKDKINNGYKVMCKRMFNIEPERSRFNIKQELVSKSGIWIAKKRYVQWVIDENGVAMDEIAVKGLDVVRSSFPPKFRDFMKKTTKDANGKHVHSGIMFDFLTDVDKSIIDKKVLDFKRDINIYPVEEIARNTSIKEVERFQNECVKAECSMGRFPKIYNEEGKTVAFPAHIKAAINFNSFVVHHELDKLVEPMVNGEKIKYVYLKMNPYRLEEIAFRGYNDPKELMDFIIMYADGNALYEKELRKKLHDFYDAIGWSHPTEADSVLKEFFSDFEDSAIIKKEKKKKQISVAMDNEFFKI